MNIKSPAVFSMADVWDTGCYRCVLFDHIEIVCLCVCVCFHLLLENGFTNVPHNWHSYGL